MDTLDEYKQVANYSHNKRNNKFNQHHQPHQLVRMRRSAAITKKNKEEGGKGGAIKEQLQQAKESLPTFKCLTVGLS
jgi:hypothetical protein